MVNKAARWQCASIIPLLASLSKAVTVTFRAPNTQTIFSGGNLTHYQSKLKSFLQPCRNRRVLFCDRRSCSYAFISYRRLFPTRCQDNCFSSFNNKFFSEGFHLQSLGRKFKSSSRTRVRRTSRPVDEVARPFPTMPSQQFLSLAQSQLELLASCLQQQDTKIQDVRIPFVPSASKAKSIALYLPRENLRTGHLEFVPVVLYPDITSRRVWIAPESSSADLPFIPRTLPTLPGFTHASSILPQYPFASAVEESNLYQVPQRHGRRRGTVVDGEALESTSASSSAGIGVVEEVTSSTMYGESIQGAPSLEDGNLLSVSLFKGSQTIGVLLIWPASLKPIMQDPGNEFGIAASYTNQLSLRTSEQSTSFAHSSSEQSRFWSEEDRKQVSRAAYTLSVALSMDSEGTRATVNPFGIGHNPSTSDKPPINSVGNEANAISLSSNTYKDILKIQATQTTELRNNLADNLHQVKNPLQALRTFAKLLQRRLALEEFSQGPRSSSDSAALRDLAERMMFQTDRVIDLLQPIEGIVDHLDAVSHSSSNILSLPPPPLDSIHGQKELDSTKKSFALNPVSDVAVNQPMEKSKKSNVQTFEPHESHLLEKKIAGGAHVSLNEPKLNLTEATESDSELALSATLPNRSKSEESSECDRSSSVSNFYSIVEEPKVEMSFVPDIIEPVLRASEAVASEKGIRFEIAPVRDDDLPGVMVCPKSLQEALANVLDNAIKYVDANVPKFRKSSTERQKKPHIRVSVQPNPRDSKRGVSITVEDNGPGIPASEREKVFGRGYRSRNTQYLPGNGIGLDISRYLLSKFQADITILDSTHKTLKGAVIRIMLFSSVNPIFDELY